jgi:hypothetical protein
VENLESRVLFHAGPHGDVLLEMSPDHGVSVMAGGQLRFAPDPQGDYDGDGEPNGNPTGPAIPSVPAFSSKPDAQATLYLDFDGHRQECWGDYITVEAGGVQVGGSLECHGEGLGVNQYTDIRTPVFDMDGDRETFNSTELATIERIWRIVAEDYAPFNLNVTTVKPNSFANKKGFRVAIGGSNTDWCGSSCSTGIAWIGSFTSGYSNTAYVFSRNLQQEAAATGDMARFAQFVGDTASHESGHAFNLEHQAEWDANGHFVEEYIDGCPGATAANSCEPAMMAIMGNSRYSDRGLWWRGPTVSGAGSIQDDMAKIGGSNNGFGYRADDYGNSYSTAKIARLLGTQINHEGIIGTTADKDYFVFYTTGGQVSVQASVPAGIANLDAKLELWGVQQTTLGKGQVKVITSFLKIASGGDTLDTTNLGAQINATVGPGTYYLVVGSFGGYGDVGQYTLAGTLPPASFPPLTALSAVIIPAPNSTANSTPNSVVTQHLQMLPTEQTRPLAAGADHLSPVKSKHHEAVRFGTQLECRHLHVDTLDRLLEQSGTDDLLNELLPTWW